MEKERFFISNFNNKAIGDDGAYIDGTLYSSDTFCEEVHFKRSWLSLEQIAKKALLVNISDAIAMNGTPRYGLVDVALPKELTAKELATIAQALQDEAKRWGIEIIGGDTVAASKLHFAITLISTTKRPLFRRPVRPGYLLGHTGTLGKVGWELRRLLRGGRIHKRSKFATPRLRHGFMGRCARLLKAAMDISDGLFDDLAKLGRLNRIGFRLLLPIPKAQGCSGEEYELLFAIDPRDRIALERCAAKSRTPIRFVARALRGRFLNRCKPHHF
ncbi:MAG: thiamine-phosphate kinase [Nitratiruptor sp.]|nr:thiamine-phosphate kinase [Nitratiruptor sp.]NPA83194.1 thiamine-phosphate kinase [Campylobacterota bacterium]